LISVKTGYLIVIYEVWSGMVEKDDPATDLERWASVYNGDTPKDVELKMMDSRYGFEGLEGAEQNIYLETVREADSSVQEHMNDQERLLKSGQTWNYQTNSYEDRGSAYEKFLGAIERAADNDEDEEAWAIINEWRTTRQLRDEDRARNL